MSRSSYLVSRARTGALAALLLAACHADPTSSAPVASRLGDQALAGWSEWSEPVSLGPVVNSAANELSPEISKDGLHLYFGSSRPGGKGGNDIWVARRASADAPWETPVNVDGINSPSNENGVHITRDGHWLYFTSARPGGAGGNDLYVSYRADVHDPLAWRQPVSLGAPINDAQSDLAGSIHGPEFYFWRGVPPNNGNGDIYVSIMKGDTFGEPELVESLNSDFHDAKPGIRTDGREIVFVSNRPGSSGFDLWYSTRAGVGQSWATPQLIPGVNSAADESRPSLSPDGTMLLFDANRPGGVGGLDLWVATRRRGEGH